MSRDIFFEIHQGLPREGPGRNIYTEKAFRMLSGCSPLQMLSGVDKPRILDVGCGPGAPTIELARISRGEVTGIDTHQPYLDELKKRAETQGLSGRVKAVKCSMFEMDFPDESFDIVWAEGSIYIMGFEKGLRQWRRFLKPRGFLAVHEVVWLQPGPPEEILEYWNKLYPAIKTIPETAALIPGCGYDVLGHFPLPEDAWWMEYYGPLQERILALREKYSDNPKALEALDSEQKEIDMYKKYCQWYGSAFFIMQKR